LRPRTLDRSLEDAVTWLKSAGEVMP
jgi:hypothetical protein